MRLGAHMSTAGGVYKAFQRGDACGCDSMLVFTKSNRQWKAKPLTEKDITAYRKASEQYAHVYPVAVHASYLINIASPDEAIWQKSYDALKIEVERAAAFQIPLLTFHPGSHMKSGEEAGLNRIATGLKQLLAETAEIAADVTICLETMAGQGTNLGYQFEHLAYVLDDVKGGERLGVCFDTCHVLAAGYDIRTPDSYAATMAQFDQVIGLEHIKCFHFNDSKHSLGERKDRHEHIGRGQVGAQGFANFLNDPRWADHPAHLETPKKEKDEAGNEVEMDPINLAALRELIV